MNPDSRPYLAAIVPIVCVSMVGLGLSLTIPLLSLEMERMGISGLWIGLNSSIAGVSGICILPFLPRIAARTGIVSLLWASIAVAVLSLLAFKMTMSLIWWFPIRFVFSAALGILFVLSEYWINTAAKPERRGLTIGIYTSVLSLGFAAGPLLLQVFGSSSGWAPYCAGAVLLSLAGMPLVFAGSLSPDMEQKTGRSFWSLVFIAPAATLAALIFGAVETGSFAILPVYGLRIGLDDAQAPMLVSAMAFGCFAFQVPIGILSDRIDRLHVLFGAALVGVVGAVAIPFIPSSLLPVLLFVWGGVAATLYTVGLAHLGATFTGADLVGANAAFVILYNIGLVIGPPVAGVGLDLFLPYGFALALAGFFTLYLAAFPFMRRTSPRGGT